MTGVSINMPAHSSMDTTGLDEVLEYFDFAVPGTLAYVVPGAWAGAALPTGTVPNHAQWAMNTLGEGARQLTISGQPVAGVAEFSSRKALNVAFRRAAGVASEAFTIGNKRLRDHVAQYPTHKYGAAVSLRVTRPAAASWTPAASHRVIGFVDGTNDRNTLRGNPARALLTGYPTTARRLLVRTLDITVKDTIDYAVGVWDGYDGAISDSTTLIAFHNGGAGAPGLCFELFAAAWEDLTISGRTPEQFRDAFGAEHTRLQQTKYLGDTVKTYPETL